MRSSNSPYRSFCPTLLLVAVALLFSAPVSGQSDPVAPFVSNDAVAVAEELDLRGADRDALPATGRAVNEEDVLIESRAEEELTQRESPLSATSLKVAIWIVFAVLTLRLFYQKMKHLADDGSTVSSRCN